MGENNKTDEFPYITERLNEQIAYYGKKSIRLQREYYILSILNIIILALVPFLTLLSDFSMLYRYIIAGSSAVASILSSILLLRKTKDNWLEFRATGEALKTELEEYRYRVGLYDGKTEEASNKILVQQCEKIMQSEHSAWYDRMKKESTQT